MSLKPPLGGLSTAEPIIRVGCAFLSSPRTRDIYSLQKTGGILRGIGGGSTYILIGVVPPPTRESWGNSSVLPLAIPIL